MLRAIPCLVLRVDFLWGVSVLLVTVLTVTRWKVGTTVLGMDCSGSGSFLTSVISGFGWVASSVSGLCSSGRIACGWILDFSFARASACALVRTGLTSWRVSLCLLDMWPIYPERYIWMVERYQKARLGGWLSLSFLYYLHFFIERAATTPTSQPSWW